MCEFNPGFGALDYAMMGALTFTIATATHVAVSRTRDLFAQLRLLRAAATC